MKTVFSNQAQCAHVWAQQTQSDGRSGREEFAESAAAWRAGESRSFYRFPNAPTMLRLSGSGANVETSRGASVPVADARNLWRIVSHCVARGFEYRQPLSVGDGHFTLCRIAADGTATVGCHTINYAESLAFAKSQGWAAE